MAINNSKKTSGSHSNSQVKTLHSVPVSFSSDFNKSPAVFRPPIAQKKSAVELSKEQQDNSLTTPNARKSKVYSTQTGIPDTEPIIVASSEFIPLFKDQSNRTQQGQTLLSRIE